jgi:pyruvate/2-oxoglutarate dehydrogenase complex dihydrolipoamide dehydrogenase (E3) component
MGKVTEENDGFIKLLIDQKKEKDLGCNIIEPMSQF